MIALSKKIRVLVKPFPIGAEVMIKKRRTKKQ
jgi:hypothetical protein